MSRQLKATPTLPLFCEMPYFQNPARLNKEVHSQARFLFVCLFLQFNRYTRGHHIIVCRLCPDPGHLPEEAEINLSFVHQALCL